MFLINAHPTRGRLLEYGRLIEKGIYKIIIGKKGGVYWRWAFKRTWAFIGENTVSIFLQLFILLPTPDVGKNSLHCCAFLYDHCFQNVLCIVLNKFYCILFRRCFNLKFKKQSEKLKHY